MKRESRKAKPMIWFMVLRKESQGHSKDEERLLEKTKPKPGFARKFKILISKSDKLKGCVLKKQTQYYLAPSTAGG